MTKGLRVLAHRGASGHSPENSLAAFREAVRLGADGVELDLHVAASGHLIVHHDPVIPGVGPIAALGLSEIRRTRLSNSEPIPTLEEVLRSVAGTAPFEVWIELKALPAPADPTLFDAIDRAPDGLRCGVHSFDHRIVARLGDARPALRRGILSASYPVDPVGAMRGAGAETLWQDWRLIDRALVTAVHAAGGEIIAWTVNDREAARNLAALGVDGLCGNWPERLRVS